MKTVFVDSNVFIRFFTMDDQGQGEKAEELFRKAGSGQIKLLTAPPVLFEVAWTLKAAYDVPGEKILEMLECIISMDGITVTDSAVALDALGLAAETEQGFADAYIAVTARLHSAEVATFNNRHFSKLGVPLYKI